MKELLNTNKVLLKLVKDIKKHSAHIEPSDSASNQPEVNSEELAVHQWYKKKIKDALQKSPFYAYSSMIPATDKQRQLSLMMFGHHVAEIFADSKEQINNPLINTREYYHRSTPLNNPIVDALFNEFSLPHFNREEYDYVPVSFLANNPIEDVLALFKSGMPELQLIKKEGHNIAVLIIPKASEARQKILDKIKNMGLVASSWEIADNIRDTKLPIPTQNIQITLTPDLPKTIEELLNGEIMVKLKQIAASGEKYPTTLLATCLEKLLSDLPENISASALQRIAMMIDITNTYYTYHYPRYALCVYSVLHEISLALIANKDAAYIESEYARFKEEAASTLTSTLCINSENLSESTFLATASTSGASACAVAMRIASRMRTPNAQKPKVKIFKPCYYELPNTFNLDSTDNANSADVLMISAGPIVNPEGLTPGIDINLFVKKHIIDTSRTKPVTLIVDATTSLYKNIKLNDEVQQLISKGQLSIIIHESHQKFGLIHTDQAQYGRLFGWCSKLHYSEDTLQEVEENSKKDFLTHPDMRIGAFVSTRCGETLELIKKRHFANGALLRKMLVSHSISSSHIEKHAEMQQNEDELLFLTDKETAPGSYISEMEYAAYGTVESRNSFGHFTITTTPVVGQRRMSPDASDTLDTLVATSHMRIARHYSYSARTMLQQIINYATKKEELALEYQIVVAGLLHSASSFCPIIPRNFGEIQFLDRPITPDDKKKIIISESNPKNIIVSTSISASDLSTNYYLGYYSHGNMFRQIKIQDPYLISLIKAGTITNSKNHPAVKKYMRSLQEQYLPKNANFPLIYATVSNALASCSALKSRPSIMDIQKWLVAIENVIIEEYEPVNPASFLQTIKEFYATNQQNVDIESMKHLFIFLSKLDSKVISPVALGNKNFEQAIKKVQETNHEILKQLKSSPKKFKAANESSKAYLHTCFDSLHKFYSNPTPNEEARTALLESIKSAEKSYLKVLAVDRSTLSQVARYLLMAVTNFIATLTFGVAHYMHYKATGTAAFFSGTNSKNKLCMFHKTLADDFVNAPENNSTAAAVG